MHCLLLLCFRPLSLLAGVGAVGEWGGCVGAEPPGAAGAWRGVSLPAVLPSRRGRLYRLRSGAGAQERKGKSKSTNTNISSDAKFITELQKVRKLCVLKFVI